MDYPKSVPGVGLVNGKFVDENQATGQVGSLIPSAWGNAVTDEILGVLALAGVAAVEGNNAQLRAAIQALLNAKAPLASPALTGTPTAPTAAAGTNTTQIATTAFVAAVKAALDATDALKAPLASPALTGTPTAPTAAAGTNTTQLATTAFVRAAVAALVDSSPAALDTLNELAAALGNDPNFATTMTNALAGKIDIAIPNLTNFNTAEAGPFMGSAAAATGSPDTTGGVIWGWTFLDAAKSQSRVQLAMHTGTGGLHLRIYSGVAWGAWKDFTPPSDAKVARAWVDFNGTGTVAIRSSHNVSSVTDNGTGDYTVNLASAMPNANYAAVASGSASDAAITGINCAKAYSRTTTSFKVGTTTSATGASDFLHVDATVFSN
ncbi:hypothetical protein [Pseudomonas aeruginosa]|uniref:hypothetical protein n=1 Tax=Pseudomonas aeruginosa TaxID=287 RepID=UPI001FD82FA0|nr:hypothetical protein [Pseudomonas aeruginosa]